MYRELKNAYIKTVGETDIIAIFNKDGWSVYYQKPEYPMIYAFGLPNHHHTADVMMIAEENIDDFADLFE